MSTTTATDILHHFRDCHMGPARPGAAAIPDHIQPAPWMHITNLPTFIETHLLRSECPCALLRRLAIRNLTALYHHLSP